MVAGDVQPLALGEWESPPRAPTVAYTDRFWVAGRCADGIRARVQWAAITVKLGRIEFGNPCVAVSVGSERDFPPPT